MCTNFVPSTRQEISAQRLCDGPLPQENWPAEAFPGYTAPILMAQSEEQPAICEVASFGLVPPWCRDAQHAKAVSKGTYNARSETASVRPSFRSAGQKRQWALVPMSSFFEPCWESGHGVRWRITLADQSVFAAAGIWEQWRDAQSGLRTLSFSLLTVNADMHPFMSRMHRPGEEKRMPVLLDLNTCRQWLSASPAQALAVLQAASQQQLAGQPAPLAARPRPENASPNLSLF